MRRKSAVLAEHCAAIGRDPAEIEHSTATQGVNTAAADALVDAGFSLFTIGVPGRTTTWTRCRPGWPGGTPGTPTRRLDVNRTLGWFSPSGQLPVTESRHWVIRWCRHPIVTSQIGIETNARRPLVRI